MRTRKPCSKGRSSEILGWGRAWWRANIPKFLGHFFPLCSLFASAAFSIFLTCTNTGTNPVGVYKSHLVLSPLTLGSLPAPCSWPQHPTPARNFIRCYLLREGKRKNPLFLHRLAPNPISSQTSPTLEPLFLLRISSYTSKCSVGRGSGWPWLWLHPKLTKVPLTHPGSYSVFNCFSCHFRSRMFSFSRLIRHREAAR